MLNLAQELQPIHARQIEICNHAVAFFDLLGLQEALGRWIGGGVETGGGQLKSDGRAKTLVIRHHRNRRSGRALLDLQTTPFSSVLPIMTFSFASCAAGA